MKTPKDFKDAVHKLLIKVWIIHKCSVCNVACGYLFQEEQIFYMNDCNCTPVYHPPDPRTWKDVADHYNLQTDKSVIREMNIFWGFEDTTEMETALN